MKKSSIRLVQELIIGMLIAALVWVTLIIGVGVLR